MNLVKTRDDLEREAPRLKKEWIQKIDSIDDANRKYVLVFEDLVFEADHEQGATCCQTKSIQIKTSLINDFKINH